MRPQSSHPTDRNASTLLLTLHLGQLFSALTASEPTIYYSSLAIMIAEGGYGGGLRPAQTPSKVTGKGTRHNKLRFMPPLLATSQHLKLNTRNVRRPPPPYTSLSS